MHNHNHDLVQQVSEKLDSIWRYKEYGDNARAGGCDNCVKLWEQLKKEDLRDVHILRDEIVRHVEAGGFAPHNEGERCDQCT